MLCCPLLEVLNSRRITAEIRDAVICWSSDEPQGRAVSACVHRFRQYFERQSGKKEAPLEPLPTTGNAASRRKTNDAYSSSASLGTAPGKSRLSPPTQAAQFAADRDDSGHPRCERGRGGVLLSRPSRHTIEGELSSSSLCRDLVTDVYPKGLDVLPGVRERGTGTTAMFRLVAMCSIQKAYENRLNGQTKRAGTGRPGTLLSLSALPGRGVDLAARTAVTTAV